jgi:D-sorbitol dehydrogenase-like protein
MLGVAVLGGCVPTRPATSAGTPPATAGSVAESTQSPSESPSSELSLDEFIALSSKLTGFAAADLSRDLAPLYLGSLQVIAQPEDLRELAGATKPSPLGDKLIDYWYSGVYDTPNGPAVATYTEALAWKSVGYTSAPTVCGGETGYWSRAPQQA